MSTEAVDHIQTLFSKLESRESILSSFTSVFKTLTSHFTTLEQSIDSKSQILDTKLQTLDSDYQNSLEKLHLRKQSIPDRFASISSQIETRTQLAMAEIEKPEPDNHPKLEDELKSLCIKMDEHRLLKLILSKRKEAAAVLKDAVGGALAECIDPKRLVLDSVKAFMDRKVNPRSGQPDRRWACGILVVELFPHDKLKERKENVEDLFPRPVLEQAKEMAKEWKEKAQEMAAAGLAKGGGEGVYGMGPTESCMFLQFVAGFGLKDLFEYEFLKNLGLRFMPRKEMAKLSRPLFGEKVEDLIKELLENGKDTEAVYFAIEAGLTEKYDPISLLKSYLSRTEKNAKDALRKGNYTSEAEDEAYLIESSAYKHIVKCVEENNLENDFPIASVKYRHSTLERIKNEKKRAAIGGGFRRRKRGHSRSGPPPPHRPAKISKYSYPPPYAQRNPVSPAQQNPGSSYPAPYSYPPSQSTYDTAVTAAPYGSTYGGSHLPGSAQAVSQPPPPTYAVQHGENIRASYGGGQISYGSYDYSAGAQNTYPLPYTQ